MFCLTVSNAGKWHIRPMLKLWSEAKAVICFNIYSSVVVGILNNTVLVPPSDIFLFLKGGVIKVVV